MNDRIMPEHSQTAEVSRGLLHIGARGWEFPAWDGSYYPADLPPDWRLAYYANDFPQVLVPQSRWAGAEPEQAKIWRDEVSTVFRFYLELADARPEALARLSEWIDALGPALGGTLVAGVMARGLGAPAAACLFHSVAVVRPAVVPQPFPDCAPVGVLVAPSGLGSLREQRRLFGELLARIGSQGPIPMFFCGNPPSLQALQDAVQLAQLMGVA